MDKELFISNELREIAIGINMISKLLETHNGSSAEDWTIRAQAAETLRVFVSHIHELRKTIEEADECSNECPVDCPF